MKKISKFIIALLFIALIVYGFLGYCVTKTQYGDGEIHDGLGRVLTPAPPFMRFVFNSGKFWAGWGWYLTDMAIFFTCFALLITPMLVKRSRRDDKEDKTSQMNVSAKKRLMLDEKKLKTHIEKLRQSNDPEDQSDYNMLSMLSQPELKRLRKK